MKVTEMRQYCLLILFIYVAYATYFLNFPVKFDFYAKVYTLYN